MSQSVRTAVIAWLVAAVYYFYQYVLRSAPAVMMPQLSEAFGLSALGVASMVGVFYYGYSPFSLIAGAAIDRLGPRKVVPVGAAAVGIGALLFSTGKSSGGNCREVPAGRGRCLRAGGSRFHRQHKFPRLRAATLIGATQMFGMAGGSAGQSVVGPMIAGGLAWNHFWIGMGVAGLLISVLLVVFLPRQEQKAQSGGLKERSRSFRRRLQKPAVDPLRHDRRVAFYSHDDLRHDLGCALPSGGARF